MKQITETIESYDVEVGGLMADFDRMPVKEYQRTFPGTVYFWDDDFSPESVKASGEGRFAGKTKIKGENADGVEVRLFLEDNGTEFQIGRTISAGGGDYAFEDLEFTQPHHLWFQDVARTWERRASSYRYPELGTPQAPVLMTSGSGPNKVTAEWTNRSRIAESNVLFFGTEPFTLENLPDGSVPTSGGARTIDATVPEGDFHAAIVAVCGARKSMSRLFRVNTLNGDALYDYVGLAIASRNGLITDHSMHSNTLAVNGVNPVTSIENGMQFVAADSHVYLADARSAFLGEGDFTIEFVTDMQRPNGSDYTVAKCIFDQRKDHGDGVRGYGMTWDEFGDLHFHYQVSGQWNWSVATWNLRGGVPARYHMALVREKGRLTLFIDGVAVGGSVTMSRAVIQQDINVGMFVGSNYIGSQGVRATMADIRFSDIARYKNSATFDPPSLPLPLLPIGSDVDPLYDLVTHLAPMSAGAMNLYAPDYRNGGRVWGSHGNGIRTWAGMGPFGDNAVQLWNREWTNAGVLACEIPDQLIQTNTIYRSDFTVEGWSYHETPPGLQQWGRLWMGAPVVGVTNPADCMMIAHHSNGGDNSVFWAWSECFWTGGGGPVLNPTQESRFPTSKWVHFAYTRASENGFSVYRLFIDGKLASTASYAENASNPAFYLNNYTNSFGGNNRGVAGAEQVPGAFSNLRITKACRYRENFQVPTKAFPRRK